jgi:arsenate reductase
MSTPQRLVIFVCPHGAAKSVVAAACLAEAARRRGADLATRAVGLDPDPHFAPGALAGLRRLGLPEPGGAPRRLTPEDLAAAWRVITLGCDEAAVPGAVWQCWDDVPPVSEGFEAAHAVIERRVGALLDAIADPAAREVPA